MTSASQESEHKGERKRLSPRTPALCGLGRVKVMRAALAAMLGPKVRGGARSVPGWASEKAAGSLHAARDRGPCGLPCDAQVKGRSGAETKTGRRL